MSVIPIAPKDTTVFYLTNGKVRNCLLGIIKLQQRDDNSGKSARKLGRQRRALNKISEEIDSQIEDIKLAHAIKYPLDHPDESLRGKPTIVYEENPDGTPKFKLDDYGQPTGERVVKQGHYNIKDITALENEIRDLLKEPVVVECPAFHVRMNAKDEPSDLDKFAQVQGSILDPLYDLEMGSDATIPPESEEEAETNTRGCWGTVAEETEVPDEMVPPEEVTAP